MGQDASESDFYRITTFDIPEKEVLEAGAFQIMSDGRMAVATRRGEVWMIKDPLAEKVTASQFSRFAHGLHEPLGLAERDGWLYVTQRSDVSRIRDRDGDGVADDFEVVGDGWEINGDYHEYAFGSKFDRQGNLWVALCLTGSFGSDVPFRGWCMRVTPDGKTIPTTYGLRSPGGIAFNSQGDTFYTDNQGPWNGTCSLKQLVPGRFVGHPGGNEWTKQAQEFKGSSQCSRKTTVGLQQRWKRTLISYHPPFYSLTKRWGNRRAVLRATRPMESSGHLKTSFLSVTKLIVRSCVWIWKSWMVFIKVLVSPFVLGFNRG
jgi:hypothetical protein